MTDQGQNPDHDDAVDSQIATASSLDGYGARIVATFPLHRRVFVCANMVLTALNIVIGGGWWAFWPLVIWGVPFAVHYLWFKTEVVDQSWVDERTFELNMQSYDRSHIEAISGREEPELWGGQQKPAAPPKKRG
jgi:hypothetical protein